MKILMDIFTNWRKGKKEHDKSVESSKSKEIVVPKGMMHIALGIDSTPERIKHAEKILKSIAAFAPQSSLLPNSQEENHLEAKHWQILAEYAQDQVKALTKVDQKEPALPDGAAYVNVRSDKSILDKAEERHGFTMSKE